jgi:molybdopterin converting factor subunit 1
VPSTGEPPIRITVRFFAAARDLAGCETAILDLPAGSTAANLRARLAATYPALAGLLRHSLFAVGNEYAGDDSPLADGAEVAVIPPVSGG